MARPYEHERVEQLRAEGKGNNEISRIMKRERLEYAIFDIEDIGDVKRVLEDILKHVAIN